MAIQALRHENTFMKACDKCKRVSHHFYRVPFGEFMYNFCSGECIQRASENFEKNKNINFEVPVERSPDMIGEDFE